MADFIASSVPGHNRQTRHVMRLAVARAFTQGHVPSNQDLRRMGLSGYRPCRTCGKPTRGDQCYKCTTAEKTVNDEASSENV